jgi:site-specific recombinase XerC
MGYWKGWPKGQKAALSPKAIAAIRAHLVARTGRLAVRDRALFALAIDSMLRGVDLVALRVGDVVASHGSVCATLISNQRKTAKGACRPVACYLSRRTQELLGQQVAGIDPSASLFTGQGRTSPISTQQLRKLVKRWCAELDSQIIKAPWPPHFRVVVALISNRPTGSPATGCGYPGGRGALGR